MPRAIGRSRPLSGRSRGGPHYCWPQDGRGVGMSRPRTPPEPGDRERWRVLNASEGQLWTMTRRALPGSGP